ncbi:TonB-dependent receptor [uncultured Alteromonas sp.]|jgi:iron complex outermembrane receptor protein|uniref:TonB-dependent receptor domain-containing protein n=1 Tax=uncultured Alteromonas sp. TaxID=179113 RepID=UPI0025D771E9|nr:TonB-dependent receptor [uncultured Alteromonas sp.]
MFTNTKLAKSVKLACAVGAASTLLMPNAVLAQDSEAAVERISVTGSRILKSEFSSSSPISSFGEEDIAVSGVASIDEFLKDVPAFTGYQMGTSTNNGSESGQKKIDMRGLGFNRTLVLINGRRMIGDVNGDGAVDLNNVPEAMIKRVDVLKDGASTIYGSDALAGVVNFVLDDEFVGLEAGANIGMGVSDGQAQDDGFYVKAGVATNKANMVMSLSYSNQDEMKQEERDFSAQTLYPLHQGDGVFDLVTSGSSNSRKIRVPGEGNWIVDDETGEAREFSAVTDLYDYSPVNALIQPNERWQISAIGKVELTDSIEGYMEGIYTRRTSQQRLAPDASFAVTSSFETPNNGLQWNDWVPASNPYNPFGVNADNPLGISDTAVRVNRRFVESGGRLFRQSADTYRMLAGLRGELGSSMFWDVSYSYSEAETIDETLNYGRFDRWATAVDPDACAADSACPGVLNPFGPYGSITDEQMDYLTTGSLKDLYRGTMELFAANISGEAFEMGGGYAGWSLGYEHRNEKGAYSPDEFLAAGLTTGGANDPQSGGFSVDEVYGELYLPVTDDLDISASARYSDYDTSAGTSFTYKVGADYLLTDDARVRLSYATGFRAPNISELNAGQSTGFPIIVSVCEFGDRKLDAGDISQTTYDNCQNLGVDTSDAGEFGFAWQSAYTTSAPAEELEPEESKSYNIGVVLTPSMIEGLAVNIDYWNIEIENVIGAPDMNDLYRTCMGSENLSSVACDAFDGAGGPHFTPDYDIFPADAVAEFGNLGTLETDGVDVDLSYSGDLDMGAVTGYSVSWSGTWVNSYKRIYPLTGAIELAGTANGFEVFPEWRWQSNIGLNGDDWSFNYKIRFIGETTDRLQSAVATADAVAEQTVYHDVVGTYTFGVTTVTVGVNNLTDQDPPYFHSAFNANTEPGTYDVIGRRVFGNVVFRF